MDVKPISKQDLDNVVAGTNGWCCYIVARKL